MAHTTAGIDRWIKQHLRADAPHARSLIVTLFGDSVAPYNDGIWLGDLIELLQPFGVNERLVRTSVFRLTEDQWLNAERDGRRSYYTLAPGGKRRFQYAYQRVYTPLPDWDGTWTVVVLAPNEPAPSRTKLRAELEWEGFAPLGSGVFVRPEADMKALRELLDDLGLRKRAAVLERARAGKDQADAIFGLVARGWDLDPVARSYETFLRRFTPLAALLGDGAALHAEEAFVVQTLLIDSFRRITVHDPLLPAALLPAGWPGGAAYDLCGQLYRRTYRAVRDHVLPRLRKEGLPVQIPADVNRRFGGL